MLNLVNPRAIRALGGLQLILLGALISCGGGGPSQPVAAPPTGGGTVEPPPQGLLVALESPDAFKQKITAGFTTASSERAIAVGDGAVSSDGLDGGSDGGTLDVTSEGAAGDAAVLASRVRRRRPRRDGPRRRGVNNLVPHARAHFEIHTTYNKLRH